MNRKKEPLDTEGRPHGVWEKYYSDLTLEWRRTYFHGVQHGVYEDYHKNGTLITRRNYFHGKLHGTYEEY